MATLYEIRRANLRDLIRDRGNGEVAKAAGYSSASYLSQMVGRKAKRPVTEATARRIEAAFALPTYWLDQERDLFGRAVPGAIRPVQHIQPVDSEAGDNDPIPNNIVDPDNFTHCAAMVSNAMVTAGVKLPKDKFAKIVVLMLNNEDQSENGLQKLANNLVAVLS